MKVARASKCGWANFMYKLLELNIVFGSIKPGFQICLALMKVLRVTECVCVWATFINLQSNLILHENPPSNSRLNLRSTLPGHPSLSHLSNPPRFSSGIHDVIRYWRRAFSLTYIRIWSFCFCEHHIVLLTRLMWPIHSEFWWQPGTDMQADITTCTRSMHMTGYGYHFNLDIIPRWYFCWQGIWWSITHPHAWHLLAQVGLMWLVCVVATHSMHRHLY